jgi:hypothetical protein
MWQDSILTYLIGSLAFYISYPLSVPKFFPTKYNLYWYSSTILMLTSGFRHMPCLYWL